MDTAAACSSFRIYAHVAHDVMCFIFSLHSSLHNTLRTPSGRLHFSTLPVSHVSHWPQLTIRLHPVAPAGHCQLPLPIALHPLLGTQHTHMGPGHSDAIASAQSMVIWQKAYKLLDVLCKDSWHCTRGRARRCGPSSCFDYIHRDQSYLTFSMQAAPKLLLPTWLPATSRSTAGPGCANNN